MAQGVFKPQVMFFGMYNSLGTLQQMMNEIFADMLIVFLVIFMDDLLIATNKILRVEHIIKVRQVLQRLREYGLCLKSSKCMLAEPKVEFL